VIKSFFPVTNETAARVQRMNKLKSNWRSLNGQMELSGGFVKIGVEL
jgi:hypothetical protein